MVIKILSNEDDCYRFDWAYVIAFEIEIESAMFNNVCSVECKCARRVREQMQWPGDWVV